MHRSRRAATFGAAAALSLGSLALVTNAIGDGGHGHGDGNGGKQRGGHAVLSATLVGSQPAPADPVVHGVAPGGAPWVIGRNEVTIKADGRIKVRIRGLLIPATATAPACVGPVTKVSASLFCGADSTTTPVGTTPEAPLSATGDAKIRGRLTLPARCVAPVVLIHPTTTAAPVLGVYIAASGFGA